NDGENARDAYEPEDGQTVLSGGWVVHEAEQKDLIGDGSDGVLRSFNKRQTQVARGKLDVEEIAGDASLGRADDGAGGVRVFSGVGVEPGSEADGLAEFFDVRCVAGQKVPTGGRLGTTVG